MKQVHYWYKQFQELFAISSKERRAIALDENKVKRCKKQLFLWTAVDVDSKEIVGVYISATRSGLDTYSFLKYVLRFCTNKPVVIGDKAPWYRWALQRLGLEYKHETFNDRNAVEQWYSPFKHRVKRLSYHNYRHLNFMGWFVLCLFGLRY